MGTINWWLLLFFVSACLCQPDIDEIKKRLKKNPINLDAIKQAQHVDDEQMAHLLKVDYWFRTETIIYDLVENKEKAPSTVIAGNYSFDTLHHDNDGAMLGKLSLTLCKTDNCGDPAPVYLSFRQGGNNLLEVATILENGAQASWNFLYALANTIYTPAEYGEGDTQTVDTVYGRCRVQFGRPEDKRFRRIIDNCDLGTSNWNFSRFEGLDQVEYSQDAWYTQNTKVDADIIMIDAVELISFKSPFHEKHGFTVESRTHVEITNRTRLYIPKHCPADLQAEKCAVTKFGAVRVGTNKYEDVQLSPKQENKLSDLIDTYRTHLQDMGDSHICHQHSELYAQIAQEARFATRQNWLDIIRNPENDHVLSIIANALGGVGTAESISIAKDLYLIESPEHFDSFLFGIATSPSNNPKWHKELMYWLEEIKDRKPKLYWQFANTIATVLNRRCQKSPSSLNSCNKQKETIVNKFIKDISVQGYSVQVLEILENIPIFESYSIAKKLICSGKSAEIQTAALRIIRAADKTLYESQLTKKLINVFRNTCPRPQSTTQSQLAIDILLKCIPDHQNVATLILRTESLLPDDQEKWQYLYSAIEASGEKDELKAELWHRMRQFKVFRSNYLHRSLIADSHAHWQEIGRAAGFRLQSASSSEFTHGGDNFKRSDYELTVRRGKHEYPIFSLDIDTTNLDQFVAKPDQVIGSGAPEARVRLGMFAHKFPSYSIFKSSGDILSTVWDADGRTIKAFEGHIPLRDARIAFPLLSGMTLDVSTSAAVSTRIHSTAEVSLWNRKSKSKTEVFSSGSLLISASLNFDLVPIHQIDSSISITSTHTTNSDVLFQSLPYDFCLKSSQSKIDISQKTIISKLEKPAKKKTIRRTQSLPGFTYRLHDSLTRKCNFYLEESRR